MEKNNYSIVDILVGVVVAVASLVLSHFLIKSIAVDHILNGLRNSAFIIMGFIVAAFNLRFKLVDLICDGGYSTEEQRKLGLIVKAKVININLSLILFVLTAASAGFASLIGKVWFLEKPIIEISIVLFSMSLYGFFHIILSFNELENFKIKINQRRAERAEADRLLKKMTDNDQHKNAFKFSAE